MLLAAIAGVIALSTMRGEAHKPITSPYTFNKDVLPIVREHCGQCHVDGGVAPMSLMTAAAATPWAESIRTELIAGRMPPWPVDTPPGRVRNEDRLTGRELNVILTWATGGTPPGDPVDTPPSTHVAQWPLGEPDLELTLDPVAIPADQQDVVKSFVIATGTTTRRLVRAVDLLPGTPAVVRSARITVKSTEAAAPASAFPLERHLALWQPGEPPVALDRNVGFELPAGAQLEVQIRYKKTWMYEGKPMRDRSRIGIYFADDNAEAVRAVTLGSEAPMAGVVNGVVGSVGSTEPLRIIAVRPDADMAGVRATAEIVDARARTTSTVFALRAEPAWARRYWFSDAVAVPAGASWSARFEPYAQPAFLSPPTASKEATPSPRALTLDIVSAR